MRHAPCIAALVVVAVSLQTCQKAGHDPSKCLDDNCCVEGEEAVNRPEGAHWRALRDHPPNAEIVWSNRCTVRLFQVPSHSYAGRCQTRTLPHSPVKPIFQDAAFTGCLVCWRMNRTGRRVALGGCG